MSLERALSVGAIAEFGRRAVTEFADIDRAMTMTQIHANATATQMERFKQITDDLEKAYKINSDRLVAGFNTYLQVSGKTFDEALAVYPKMVAAARATQTDINEIATGIGAAARNMQLSSEQQAKALEQLALASRNNLQDLGKYLPQITGALAGIGATGPETFQGLIAALETIRGRFNSTGEAVEALMGMVRQVTQSRDKGLAMIGREIERRVAEGQDFVVAMMQVLEANNMLTDQALRRFAGRGSGAMIALQTLRDAWPEMKKHYEELARAQGEIDRANEKIGHDTKAALEEISTSLHRIMETTGEFLALAGVPKAISDSADAIESLNNLIKSTKDMVEKGQMDWSKLLNESGLQRQLDHFTATWAYRWSAIKDFFWEGSQPGGKVGRELEATRKLREQLEAFDREAGGAQRQHFMQMGPVPFEGIDLEGRSGVWDLSGGFSGNIEDRRPSRDAIRAVPTDKQLWAAINAFNPYTDPLSITSRAGEVGSALRELIAQLKRLNDLYETQLTEGGAGGAGGGGTWPGLGGSGAGGGAMGRRTGAPWYGGPGGRGAPTGAPGPAIPSDTALGPGTGVGVPPRPGTSMGGVHPDLVSAVEEGAKYGLPLGYSWQWISGVRTGGRAGSYHHAGMAPGGYGGAGDIQIFDPQGRPVPNVGTGPGYSLYERFALAVRAIAQRRGMPFTWGGHFRSGVPYDLMHMQYGGPSAFGFDASRVQQEVDRQIGLGASKGLASALGAESGALAGVSGAQDATNVQNFMTGIAYLETSLDPRQASGSEAGNTGFFRMNAADAAKARAAGLPDPRYGSFGQQAAANWDYIQRFFPIAAEAIKRGDFMGAARQLGKFWVSMPGSGQQQQSAARYQRWWNILTGHDPLSAQAQHTAQAAAEAERQSQAGGGPTTAPTEPYGYAGSAGFAQWGTRRSRRPREEWGDLEDVTSAFVNGTPLPRSRPSEPGTPPLPRSRALRSARLPRNPPSPRPRPDEATDAEVARWRGELEKPIKLKIEAPEPPSRWAPRMRRAYGAAAQNTELHRERERSYADMEE